VDKEHILSEIRRTAAENDGVALGKRRFSAVTGIQYADWWGKHWVRWSEAVREAGLEPNQLRQPYSAEFLLEKLASLAREYQRFPVAGEMELKRRRDPTFP
jgi:hypothetical protein